MIHDDIIELLKMIKDCAAEDLEKAEPKPERPGEFVGEHHVIHTTRGTKLIKFPSAKSETGFGYKRAPNKVEIHHVWDGKEWKHHSTVNASDHKPPSEGNASSAKSSMDIAREKAAAAGHIKEEHKAPYVVRRKSS